jgi:hypothetical protein
MICAAVDNSASREIHAVIHFTIKRVENCVECFKMAKKMFTMRNEVIDRPSVVSDG